MLVLREHSRARCRAEIPLTASPEFVEPPGRMSAGGYSGKALSEFSRMIPFGAGADGFLRRGAGGGFLNGGFIRVRLSRV